MKIGREIRLGVLITATLLLFIWGMNYLKGIDIFNRQVRFYVVYAETGGLQESNQVIISGVGIGQVEKIYLHPDGSGKVVVRAIVDRNVQIPVNSQAIVEGDIIGDKRISIIPGDSRLQLSSGDTLGGSISPGITDILTGQIIPLSESAGRVIQRADSVLYGLNKFLKKENIDRADNIIAHLEQTLSSMENISSRAEQTLGQELDRIPDILASTEKLIADLADAEPGEAVLKAREAAEILTAILESLEKGEGTASMLLRDEELYNRLNSTLAVMEALLQDIQDNPSKYFHISVFGR